MSNPKSLFFVAKKPGPTVINIGDIWRDKNPHPFSLQLMMMMMMMTIDDQSIIIQHPQHELQEFVTKLKNHFTCSTRSWGG